MEYEKLSSADHVKKNLSLFLGENGFIEKSLLTKKKLLHSTYHQGVCKLYDELITNAFDHIRLNKFVSPVVSIYFDAVSKAIRVINSSNMPVVGVVKGSTDKIVPRVLLTNLKTSSNYSNRKDVAGRHGYGLTLANILSSYCKLRVCDKGHTYTFEKTDGAISQDELVPEISFDKDVLGPFFDITFIPDLSCFGFSDQENHVNDVAFFINARIMECYLYFGFLRHDVEILYNGKVFSSASLLSPWELVLTEKYPITVKTFKFIYTDMYKTQHIGKCVFAIQQKLKRVKSINYCILNGINVGGGTISNNIFRVIKKHILENEIDVKNYFNTFCIANCAGIVFTGQDKLKIDGKIEFDFDPKTTFPPTIFKEIIKELKREMINRKATTEKNNIQLSNYKKPAATQRLMLCLVEGLSAKTSLSRAFDKYKHRNHVGIYAMTGKIFNCVRDPNKCKLNKIVLSIAKILGLSFDGTSKKKSGFQEVLIVPDPDVDGAHIACLALCLFREIFPEFLENISILELPRFTCCNEMFFTNAEYELHISQSAKKTHNTVYAKGLGSLTEKDFGKFINDLSRYKKQFVITEQDVELLDALFQRDSAARKLMFKTQTDLFWTQLSDMSKSLIDQFQSTDPEKDIVKKIIPSTIKRVKENQISLTGFLLNRYKEFLAYSNRRSIPQLIDGDTMVTRKIKWVLLHTSKELRADAFCGQVIYQTLYHHGEASLYKSMAKLGARWPCGTNLVFVDINGEAGSRSKFGKDIPCSRYIKVGANPIGMALYNKIDFKVVPQATDENQLIDPPLLLPILPVLLINGSEGIGTGFNTYIPGHDIIEVFWWYYNKLQNIETPVPQPYIRGFDGTITLSKKNIKLKDDYDTPTVDDELLTEPESFEFEPDELLFSGVQLESPSVPHMLDEEVKDRVDIPEILNKEKLIIKGVINKKCITEIPFNISMENFMLWMTANEIEFDSSQSTADNCVFLINRNEDIEKVKRKLSNIKTINANFFDENWLHTNVSLATIFEMFYQKRLWYYSLRVDVLKADSIKDYAKLWCLCFLTERNMVQMKKTKDEQTILINECLLEWNETHNQLFSGSTNPFAETNVRSIFKELHVIDCTQAKLEILLERRDAILRKWEYLTNTPKVHQQLWLDDLKAFAKHLELEL